MNPSGSFNAYGVDESWIFSQNMDRQENNRFWYFMARMYSPADVSGEVVMVHIDKRLIEDGVYQTARAHPILRGGGPADYFEIDEVARFAMARPG